jgi:hypothetical protein
LSTLSTPTWPRTSVKLMLSPRRLVIKPLPSHGEQVRVFNAAYFTAMKLLTFFIHFLLSIFGWLFSIHLRFIIKGRAVARIPRVNGSGTHRAGQVCCNLLAIFRNWSFLQKFRRSTQFGKTSRMLTFSLSFHVTIEK